MGQIINPFRFARCSDNLAGVTPAPLLPGANFTAGGLSADGAAVNVLGALAHDVHYLVIALGGINLSVADGQCVADILVDPAGGTSWASLIDDLVCGFTPEPSATVSLGLVYHFPVFIRAGSTVGIRANTSHIVDITTGRCVMWAFGEPSRPEAWWCGQKVETIGITGGSKGTDVVPGSTGAWGSWTDIGGTTSARFGAVQLGLNGVDAVTTARGYHWQLGRGGVLLPGTPTLYSSSGAAEVTSRTGFCMPIFADIAAGTQLQVRSTANTSAPETQNVAIYGVR